MKERVFRFGPTNELVGVLTPAEPGQPARPAVILFNAGLTHRVGPSRLYVKLARRLAGQGHPVLRIDVSGVGDSEPRSDHLPFNKSVVADAQLAMQLLEAREGQTAFVLMGHCSGASGAFLASADEPRVVGVVLINLEGGNDEWTEYDRDRKNSRYYQQYYKNIAADGQRWRRLLTGRAAYGKILSNLVNGIFLNRLRTWWFARKAAAQQSGKEAEIAPLMLESRAILRKIVERGTRMLLVHSEGSTGLEYVRTMLGDTLQGYLDAQRVDLSIIPASDHLFTLQRSQVELIDTICAWTAMPQPSPEPSA
jgi:pimeloyl-ACP methyl ester carboxylesterase